MLARSLKKRMTEAVLVAALALMIFCTPSFAAEPPEQTPKRSTEQLVAAGQKLAADKCASCHSINKEGASPEKEAPPFRTFASKWPLETLEESLAEGIVTGHKEMPEVIFTPLEIDAFLDFLGSLQK